MFHPISLFVITVAVVTASGCGTIKQSYLDSFVAAEKNNLPKMLFSNLNAIDVVSADAELIYLCRVKGGDDEQTKLGQRKTQMALTEYVKRNTEKLKDLISNRIKLTIAIVSADETELYRITVNPWELK